MGVTSGVKGVRARSATVSAMARPKNQDARRSQLIQATLETIAERGLAKLSVKGIAETAGISPRLVPYYYPDLDALVEAAHQAATERYYWARRVALESSNSPTIQLAQLLYSGLPRGKDRLLSHVLDEMSINAGRNAMQATLMTLLFDREVSLYLGVLEAGRASGHFTLVEPAEMIARNFVTLEDALGLHLLARNSSMSLEIAEQQLSSYARVATGVDVAPNAHTDLSA